MPDYEFGYKADIGWQPARGLREENELSAAQLQHDIVMKARVRLMALHYTLDHLSRGTEISASVLGKVFRGDRPLHLVHLAALERILGSLPSSVPDRYNN